MASKKVTLWPAERRSEATCSVASGGYGFARSRCFSSKRKK
jgi:hypothetical protein